MCLNILSPSTFADSEPLSYIAGGPEGWRQQADLAGHALHGLIITTREWDHARAQNWHREVTKLSGLHGLQGLSPAVPQAR